MGTCCLFEWEKDQTIIMAYGNPQLASSPMLHPKLQCFSRMRSEGFPFIVWGSGGWTLVRLQLVGASFFASSWRRRGVFNSVSMGEAAKPRVFCCAHVAVSIGEAAKPRVCASFVVYGSTGTCFCKLCSIP